jgi:hypothetical protein
MMMMWMMWMMSSPCTSREHKKGVRSTVGLVNNSLLIRVTNNKKQLILHRGWFSEEEGCEVGRCDQSCEVHITFEAVKTNIFSSAAG